MAFFKECSFCETPVIDLDENNFCRTCRECFSILSQEEIENIMENCSLKKSAPDLGRDGR
jgi:hypothetical protein